MFLLQNSKLCLSYKKGKSCFSYKTVKTASLIKQGKNCSSKNQEKVLKFEVPDQKTHAATRRVPVSLKNKMSSSSEVSKKSMKTN